MGVLQIILPTCDRDPSDPPPFPAWMGRLRLSRQIKSPEDVIVWLEFVLGGSYYRFDRHPGVGPVADPEVAEIVQNTICVVGALGPNRLPPPPSPPTNQRPMVTYTLSLPQAYTLESVVCYLQQVREWCCDLLAGSGTAAVPLQRYSRCPVDLTDEQGRTLARPRVLGKEHEKLTKKQSRVIGLLIAAWPKGVTKGDFERALIQDAHKCIDNLVRRPGTDWHQVLSKPGKTARGTGYCITDRPKP
jgi:hypothetical protein